MSVYTLEELIVALKKYSGELPGKEYPEKEYEEKCYFKTFEGANHEPGIKVYIYWWLSGDSFTKEEILDEFVTPMVDVGYITYLPCRDDRDFDAIIHIPYPAGGEKDQPEAEWQPLLSLVENQYVVLISDKDLSDEEYNEQVINKIVNKWSK